MSYVDTLFEGTEWKEVKPFVYRMEKCSIVLFPGAGTADVFFDNSRVFTQVRMQERDDLYFITKLLSLPWTTTD